MSRLEACSTCTGSGIKSGTQPSTCSTCNGAGQVVSVTRTPLGAFQQVGAAKGIALCQSRDNIPCPKGSARQTRQPTLQPHPCSRCTASPPCHTHATCSRCTAHSARPTLTPPLQVATCPDCEGAGERSTPCSTCGGDGRVRRSKKISLRVPPGVDTGSRLRVRGEGNAGRKGEARPRAGMCC